jgi:hypothetical protein
VRYFEITFCPRYYAKTDLIPHYEKTLGAVRISEKRMAIYGRQGNVLTGKIFSRNTGGIMIILDTQEKFDLVMNALEDGEIVLDNRERTKEDDDEVCREIAEYKAMHQKKFAAEAVLA